MADQTPASSGTSAPRTAPATQPRARTGSGAHGGSGAHRSAGRASGRTGGHGQHPAAIRRGHRHMSTRDINQMLAEMGSYTKYSKVVNDCKFDVKLRCQCGRSRNMSWMFLCTVCATGTKVEKEEEDSALSKYGYGSLHESPLLSSTTKTPPKDTNKDNDKNNEKKEDENEKKQRPFLCCDLCAHKITETYYCPNCLNAYPAQYVKQQTRCPRCVACPICVSPLEKIVYAGGPSSSSKDKDKDKDGKTDDKDNSKTDVSAKKDSLVAPGSEKKLTQPEPQKIGDDKKQSSSSGKNKDVYLYQCPFCFWSSNTVGLEAPTSDVLNKNLTKKIQTPYDKKLSIMSTIEANYNSMNENLRKEEERLYNARHYHKTYKTKNIFDITGTPNTGATSPKRGRRRKTSKDMELPKDGTNPLQLSRITSGGPNSAESASAMERLNKKLENKFEKNHRLDYKKADNTHIPKLDMIFVQAFNIQHVSPLFHRLQDPLHQHKEFHKFIPQRFHLMTKESFKCPNEECEQYVCKPHLRGAQANFEKRTAVLDFLPRVVLNVISGDLVASATSTILVKFQNRHMEEAKLSIDCTINDKDPFSTSKVECTNKEFEMDPINIHIKGGPKKQRKDEDTGDYIDGKEIGIHFKVTPKYYVHKDIKFSIKVMFSTTIEIKKDKPPTKKTDIRDIKFGKLGKQPTKEIVKCELPFILDFDLGTPKKLNADSSSSARRSGTSGTSSSSSMPSNVKTKLASNTSSTNATGTTGATHTTSTASTSNETSAPSEKQSTQASEDTSESGQVGHKSRGSNELEKNTE